jgi:hypothetical protein
MPLPAAYQPFERRFRGFRHFSDGAFCRIGMGALEHSSSNSPSPSAPPQWTQIFAVSPAVRVLTSGRCRRCGKTMTLRGLVGSLMGMRFLIRCRDPDSNLVPVRSGEPSNFTGRATP